MCGRLRRTEDGGQPRKTRDRALSFARAKKATKSKVTTKINSHVARKLGVRRFNASEYLRDEADIAVYLEVAAAEKDPRVLVTALGDVARARSMSELARQTGITRDALHRSLFAKGPCE